MPDILIRAAVEADWPHLLNFDSSYSTDYVWQMDWHDDTTQPGGELRVAFRPTRLPRSMRVTFPRGQQALAQAWSQRVCFLVAEQAGQLHGYLHLTHAPMPGTAWVADFVVERRWRRGGVGTVLLNAALEWARHNGFGRVVLEMQAKNHPAIAFAQARGWLFCGYNDRYYPNQDVAVFFGRGLK